MSWRRALAACALGALALAAPGALRAADAVRVQADGVAPLPPRVPGARAPQPPDAAALRALRQAAVANGIDQAVLSYAAQLARADVRDDEAALRDALGGGPLAGFTLGHGVIGELGPREAKPKTRPGDPPPKPRAPRDPIPMEHAWRIEAVVDAARVRAAVEAAGLALASGAESAAAAEVVLEAPYDAPMLSALRARLRALGASSAVPRRYQADGVTLSVRGLSAQTVRAGLASDPPPGYAAALTPPDDAAPAVRVRLRAEPSARTGKPARSSR